MREIPKAYDLSDQPPPRLLSRNKKFYFGICSEMYVRKVCATYSLAGSALRSILSSRSRGTRESRSTGGTWLTRLSSSTSRALFASLSLGSVTAWDSLLTGQPTTIDQDSVTSWSRVMRVQTIKAQVHKEIHQQINTLVHLHCQTNSSFHFQK